MAFSLTEFLPLSNMANSDAPRHWTYKTTDAIATVVASGYFDAQEVNLSVTDIIWVVASTGGTETFTAVFVDAITGAGVVTTLSSALVLA